MKSYYANIDEDSDQTVIGEAGMTAERLLEVIFEFRQAGNSHRPIMVTDEHGWIMFNEAKNFRS